jgi:putative transposase
MLDLWAYFNGVALDFSEPGKPTDNAFIESFNGRFREEGLNQHYLTSLEEARSTAEAWRVEYNQGARTAPWATWPPGSSLGQRPGSRSLNRHENSYNRGPTLGSGSRASKLA